MKDEEALYYRSRGLTDREKRNRKKRKKNAIRYGHHQSHVEGKVKSKRPKFRKVLFDNNVLIQGIEQDRSPSKEAIKLAESKNKLVVTRQVLNEFRVDKAKSPEGRNRIIEFKRKYMKKVPDTPIPSESDLSQVPGNKNDRIISFEAHSSGVKEVVTLDKRFMAALKKSHMFHVFNPFNYLKDKKK